MQEQNQLPKPEQDQEESESEEYQKEEPLAEKIERETSRLDPDPLAKMKKKINRLYGWIWVLLGLSALLFLVVILTK
jgi:hypothetical protein